ncbi:hypothetical protein ACQY74_000930 (plasmid) [Rhizobium leguminosarum bv. trifolii]
MWGRNTGYLSRNASSPSMIEYLRGWSWLPPRNREKSLSVLKDMLPNEFFHPPGYCAGSRTAQSSPPLHSPERVR